MKINILKPVAFAGLSLVVLACSVRRDTWLARNSHALSTKYNILYNGGLAMDAGRQDLQTLYADDYWDILPVEQMQPAPDAAALEASIGQNTAPGKNGESGAMPPGPGAPQGKATQGKGPSQPAAPAAEPTTAANQRNANFQRAETKATKAIQKHSMNIGGSEKNPQMDEAYLMLGQARYYDQRYLPALEAFNYVLYKYPSSNRINEVKIWREKTNMRLENEGKTISTLTKMLQDVKLKDQIYADANATLAQAFYNSEEKDSAIARLKVATEFTDRKEEKSRYQFIIGQLYESQKNYDSADAYFQKVIDMKRQGPRMNYIHSILHQMSRFNPKTGDTIAFHEKYKEMLEDRENRGYLDWINFQYALFFDKTAKNPDKALKYYNKSLDEGPTDQYLNASNYRNIGEIYFNKAKYVTAGVYYDSTMIHLKPRTREFRQIQKKRDNLEDVIKYEGIAQRNDSILKLVAMPEADRVAYYQKYIDKLKADEEAAKLKAAADAEKAENVSRAMSATNDSQSRFAQSNLNSKAPISNNRPAGGKPGMFYFYNSGLASMGKQEFRKTWGNRKLEDNWRTSRNSLPAEDPDEEASQLTEAEKKAAEKLAADADVRYTTDFYTSQLPQNRTVLDSLAKERNFAYYQLGVIYKEKFREYPRAADKLERLLSQNPEERLILPAQYNLYKIYEQMKDPRAEQVKADIISQYPDSRYAQILKQGQSASEGVLGPEAAYDQRYKEFEKGDWVALLPKLEEAIDQYTGEEIVPKFELLKARTVGKISGLEEYRKALNYVALTYPNSAEGKEAETLLGRDVVIMESMQFNDREPRSWKLLYYAPNLQDQKIKVLQEKLKKFISERTADELTQSVDFYTPTMNFVALHGIRTEDGAKGIASVLKEFKEYKIQEVPIIISSENYGVVQIKKNLDQYLADPKKAPENRPAPSVRPVEGPQKAKAPLQPRARKARPTPAAAPPLPGMGGVAMPPGDPDDPANGKTTNQQQSTVPRQTQGSSTNGTRK